MKRISAFILISAVVFLFASCSGFFNREDEATTAPFTLKSNEELQGLTPTDEESTKATDELTRVIYSDSYKASEVRSFFLDVVYGSSKIGGIKSEQLQKWETPIKYYITGKYTDADVEAVESMAKTLNSIDSFPGMKKVNLKKSANLVITYGDYVPTTALSSGSAYMPGAASTTEFVQKAGGEINSSGVLKCSENYGEIYEATIEIDVGDATVKERKQAVSKEILRMCGMPYSSEVYSNSIFAEYPYITGEPSEIDLIAFELLYNKEIRGSCTFSECFIILDELLS